MARKRTARDMDDETSSDGRRGDGIVPDLGNFLDANGHQNPNDSDQQVDDGHVKHLGSDLPAANGFSTSDHEQQNSDEHEETIHVQQMQDAVSSQLHAEAAGHQATNGKKRKKSTLSMPKKSRKVAPATKEVPIRKLRGPAPARRDTYELEEFPLGQVFIPRSAAEQAKQFSPVRKQRKAHQAASFMEDPPDVAQKGDAEVDVSSTAKAPRRSPRRPDAQVAALQIEDHQNERHREPVQARRSPEMSHEPPNENLLSSTPRRQLREKATKAAKVLRQHQSESSGEIPAVKKIRASELYPRTTGDADSSAERELQGEVLETGSREALRRVGRRPKADSGRPGRPSKVKRPLKRTKELVKNSGALSKHDVPSTRLGESSDADASPVEAGPSSEDEADIEVNNRLLGQWATIRAAHSQARKIIEKVDGEIDLDDIDVVTTTACLQKIKQALSKLRSESKDTDGADGLSEMLANLRTRIQSLCGRDPDHPTNFQDQDKSENIYGHLLPRMVKFLAHTAECFMDLDETERDAERSISVEHLRILTELTRLIVKLGDVAKHQYNKPRPSLAIFRAVHSGLVMPLSSVHEAFKEHLDSLERTQRVAIQTARREAAERLRQRNEELRMAQMEEYKDLRKKWKALHDERSLGAGVNITSYKQQKHLRLVEEADEFDFQGEPLERLELFRPRIGPLPALVEKARQTAWSPQEVAALCEGLQRYAGERVFESIFRKYCVRGGILERFNVTEIVTIAADAKEWYEQEQMEKFGIVEDWVKSIPVWTKAHILTGKENMGFRPDGQEDELIE